VPGLKCEGHHGLDGLDGASFRLVPPI
jgi:hypothetical protein